MSIRSLIDSIICYNFLVGLRLIKNLKTKIGGTFGSIISAIGAGGGTGSAVCQTTCTISPVAASVFGVSLAFTPLVFLFKFHILLWWIAFIFVGLLILTHIREIKRSKFDQSLITINTGLILIGFPYFGNQLKSFFLIPGGLLALFGIVLLIYRRKT